MPGRNHELHLLPIDPVSLTRGSTLLLEAYRVAADMGCDPWQFAVEIEELRTAGLTNNALRWLLQKGYVRHAAEVLDAVSAERTFRTTLGRTFTPAACFLLTELGLHFAEAFVTPQPSAARTRQCDPPPSVAVPVWDSDRQELRVGSELVKQFKVPARNQETILATFQEESWPVRVDDPLPPLDGVDPKRRLHETITSLNRNQKAPLLTFHGDGSGQGVRWSFAPWPRARVG
jgi:hypothetical protein